MITDQPHQLCLSVLTLCWQSGCIQLKKKTKPRTSCLWWTCHVTTVCTFKFNFTHSDSSLRFNNPSNNWIIVITGSGVITCTFCSCLPRLTVKWAWGQNLKTQVSKQTPVWISAYQNSQGHHQTRIWISIRSRGNAPTPQSVSEGVREGVNNDWMKRERWCTSNELTCLQATQLLFVLFCKNLNAGTSFFFIPLKTMAASVGRFQALGWQLKRCSCRCLAYEKVELYVTVAVVQTTASCLTAVLKQSRTLRLLVCVTDDPWFDGYSV